MVQKKILNKFLVNKYEKFLKFFIKQGKKIKIKKILENVLIQLSKKTKKSKSLRFFKIFLRFNSYIEVKRVKMRRRLFIIPTFVPAKRRFYLILKWLLLSIKKNKKKESMVKKFVQEIKKTILSDKKSNILLLKLDNYKEAFLNRSNMHYRW